MCFLRVFSVFSVCFLTVFCVFSVRFLCVFCVCLYAYCMFLVCLLCFLGMFFHASFVTQRRESGRERGWGGEGERDEDEEIATDAVADNDGVASPDVEGETDADMDPLNDGS